MVCLMFQILRMLQFDHSLTVCWAGCFDKFYPFVWKKNGQLFEIVKTKSRDFTFLTFKLIMYYFNDFVMFSFIF